MGNGNGSRKAVGIVNKLLQEGHREDYVVSIVPARRTGKPMVELRVYVNNQKTSPPYKGLTSKGGYFMMTEEQFDQLVAMAVKVKEALRESAPTAVEGASTGNVLEAPSLELLAGVTG